MAFTPVTFLGGGDGDGGRNQEVGKTTQLGEKKDVPVLH